MKKLILPLLLLVAIGMLAAVESDPSDVVGYFKKSIASDGWEAFSIPFAYASQAPDDVLGTQFADGDVLQDILTGDVSYYYGAWFGSVASIDYGKAFWLYRDPANTALDYYLLGKVDPQPHTMTLAGVDAGQWTPFGLNEAAPVALDALGITGALDNDAIVNMQTGDVAYYFGAWFGIDYTVPTNTYWYNSNAAVSFSWTYTPVRGHVTENTVNNSGTPSRNSK